MAVVPDVGRRGSIMATECPIKVRQVSEANSEGQIADGVAIADAGLPDDPIPRRFLAELTSPLTYRRLVARRKQATGLAQN